MSHHEIGGAASAGDKGQNGGGTTIDANIFETIMQM